MSSTDPAAPDAVAARLNAFEAELRNDLGDDATVEHKLIADGRIAIVAVEPRCSDALPITWMIMVQDEVIFQAGNVGGRWELAFTAEDIDLLQDLARSVIAGRALEIFAWRRSRVEITLADGQLDRQTGHEGLRSILPLPGWPRWGRRIQYAAYR